MLNGRFLTLRQVLRFYSFDNPGLIHANPQLNPDIHPEMGRLLLNSDGLVEGLPAFPINLTQVQDAEALLFFLHCLTDERVEKQKAPSITHPSFWSTDSMIAILPRKTRSILPKLVQTEPQRLQTNSQVTNNCWGGKFLVVPIDSWPIGSA